MRWSWLLLVLLVGCGNGIGPDDYRWAEAACLPHAGVESMTVVGTTRYATCQDGTSINFDAGITVR